MLLYCGVAIESMLWLWLTQDLDFSQNSFCINNTVKGSFDLLDRDILARLQVFRWVDYAIGPTADHLSHFIPIIYFHGCPANDEAFLTIHRLVLEHSCLINALIHLILASWLICLGACIIFGLWRRGLLLLLRGIISFCIVILFTLRGGCSLTHIARFYHEKQIKYYCSKLY